MGVTAFPAKFENVSGGSETVWCRGGRTVSTIDRSLRLAFFISIARQARDNAWTSACVKNKKFMRCVAQADDNPLAVSLQSRYMT